MPEPSAFLLLLPTLAFLFVFRSRSNPQPQKVKARRDDSTRGYGRRRRY